jgi:type II secretory pathway component PulJ
MKRKIEKSNESAVVSREVQTGGFTLIETMVSLLLVLLAALLGARMVSSALDGYKRSRIAFNLMQETEWVKNRLLAKPFESGEWKDGTFKSENGPLKIAWEIKGLSTSLKIAKLYIVDQISGAARRTSFYKSKYINGMTGSSRK